MILNFMEGRGWIFFFFFPETGFYLSWDAGCHRGWSEMRHQTTWLPFQLYILFSELNKASLISSINLLFHLFNKYLFWNLFKNIIETTIHFGSALVYRLYEPGIPVFKQSPELGRTLSLASYCAVILKFLIIFEQGAHIFILYKTLKMM